MVLDGETPTVRGVMGRKLCNEGVAEASQIWLKYYETLRILNYSSVCAINNVIYVMFVI